MGVSDECAWLGLRLEEVGRDQRPAGISGRAGGAGSFGRQRTQRGVQWHVPDTMTARGRWMANLVTAGAGARQRARRTRKGLRLTEQSVADWPGSNFKRRARARLSSGCVPMPAQLHCGVSGGGGERDGKRRREGKGSACLIQATRTSAKRSFESAKVWDGPDEQESQSPLKCPGTGCQPLAAWARYGPSPPPPCPFQPRPSPSASFLRSAPSFIVYEWDIHQPHPAYRLTSRERPTDSPKPSCGRGELYFRYCDVKPVLSTRSRSAYINGGVSPGKL